MFQRVTFFTTFVIFATCLSDNFAKSIGHNRGDVKDLRNSGRNPAFWAKIQSRVKCKYFLTEFCIYFYSDKDIGTTFKNSIFYGI